MAVRYRRCSTCSTTASACVVAVVRLGLSEGAGLRRRNPTLRRWGGFGTVSILRIAYRDRRTLRGSTPRTGRWVTRARVKIEIPFSRDGSWLGTYVAITGGVIRYHKRMFRPSQSNAVQCLALLLSIAVTPWCQNSARCGVKIRLNPRTRAMRNLAQYRVDDARRRHRLSTGEVEIRVVVRAAVATSES